MSSMPKQKPGKSKQDYITPPDFISAVKDLLGISHFYYDLAASPGNAQAERFYSEEDNAFDHEWRTPVGAWDWCNPPYADIAPWVLKAFRSSEEAGAQIAMLVPASTGSNWWANYVHNKAGIWLLRPRLTFGGCDAPYPKDLVLLLYARYIPSGYSTWRWIDDVK